MSALKADGHDCLPPPYPLDFAPYVAKVAAALYDNCVTDNATREQVEKYAVLAAGSASPAGVLFVPYTAAELKSDAVKCVLKAFVDSSTLSEREMEGYKSDIDDVFTLKDWTEFVTGVPGLADMSSNAVSAAMTGTVLSGIERTRDTDLFSRAYDTLAEGRTLRSLKELWWDEWIVALDEYEYNIEQCRFSDARLELELARDTADLECKALGHQYRTYEAKLRSDIIRTYNTLESDLIGDSNATATIISDLRRTKHDLAAAAEDLRSHVKIFSEIDDLLEGDLVDKLQSFEMVRLAYEGLYKRELDGLDTPRACMSIANLDRDIEKSLASLNADNPSCREALFGGEGGLTRLSPRTLRAELVQVARARSSQWWGMMDQIWASANACDMDSALAGRQQLLTEIANNPIYRISNGQCQVQEQTPLLAELDTLTTPTHCVTAEVSADIAVPNLRGKSVVEAMTTLAQFGEHFTVGELKLAQDRPEGTTLGHVAYSSPAAEQLVPAGTEVTLFVYPPKPEEVAGLRMIPHEIIGMVADEATKLLQGEDDFFAVPPAEDGDPAQDGQAPGQVQSATPPPGTYAVRGSTVQLFVATEALAQAAVQACPKTNPDPSKDHHIFDTNNNPDDETRLHCEYYDDGRLKRQTPLVDGKNHGELLHYRNVGSCDWYLENFSLYEYGEIQQGWKNKCNSTTGEPNSGTVYKAVEGVYQGGKIILHLEYYPNGNKRMTISYDSEGNKLEINSWYKNGTYGGCAPFNSAGDLKHDSNGKVLSCAQ